MSTTIIFRLAFSIVHGVIRTFIYMEVEVSICDKDTISFLLTFHFYNGDTDCGWRRGKVRSIIGNAGKEQALDLVNVFQYVIRLTPKR